MSAAGLALVLEEHFEFPPDMRFTSASVVSILFYAAQMVGGGQMPWFAMDHYNAFCLMASFICLSLVL